MAVDPKAQLAPTNGLDIRDRNQIPAIPFVMTDGDVGALAGREWHIDRSLSINDAVETVTTRRVDTGRRTFGRIGEGDGWVKRQAAIARAGNVRAAKSNGCSSEAAAHDHVHGVGIAPLQVSQSLRRRSAENLRMVKKHREIGRARPGPTIIIAVVDQLHG